ncbi:putative protein serine/threonine phosphatase [Suttonella ornithocola]|uniref:PPM-type phosphatase domain-containing protein n=2 Tax=Suttonella ornithocola TaxID=279832 RepID=A0A380MSP8_9GAMM|nr:putative protein serine/threonine phosphatase [Suttonella ornithocola]SUQ09726.1 putative protein serine/threonine phosphatase [Suttonella ornithocola]
MLNFQTAFAQMCGQGKTRTQDALFNGKEMLAMKMNKVRLVENIAFPIRVAVADGVFSSEQSHLASRFWANAWGRNGSANREFFRTHFDRFYDEVGAVAFGSSTTIAGAVIETDGTFSLCNVGDSRVYLISKEGYWQQLSHDHTELNRMIAAGEAQEGVKYSDVYNMLEQCLVADEECDEYLRPFFAKGTLQAGEALLLCTDGLHDALSHEQLENIWQSEADLCARLRALRKAVRQTRFYDDCSIVCAQRC